jgi:hypothetical protein
MNRKLTRAIRLMKTRFPEAACFAEETLIAHTNGTAGHKFRLSIVRQGICDAGESATVEGAFADLVRDAESPKQEEIERAKAILQGRGYSVAATPN